MQTAEEPDEFGPAWLELLGRLPGRVADQKIAGEFAGVGIVAGFRFGGHEGDAGLRRWVTHDSPDGPRDHAFVRDLASDDAGVTAFLNHMKAAIGKRQLNRDSGIVLDEVGDRAADDALPKIDGREDADVPLQRLPLMAHALFGLFRQKQDRFGI
jgi:hypothetical protein